MADDNHEARITRNEEDIQGLGTDGKDGRAELWTAIDSINKALAYRPPLWCTFLLMILSSTVTGLLVRMASS